VGSDLLSQTPQGFTMRSKALSGAANKALFQARLEKAQFPGDASPYMKKVHDGYSGVFL